MFFQNVTQSHFTSAILILSCPQPTSESSCQNPLLFPFASLLPCVESLLLHLPFALSADYSLTSAATARQRRRGGHTREFRGICAISAASAELPAAQKCQFSDFSRTS